MTKIDHAHPSRRTVVAGAAWATPVVVMATAAPAFAASPPPSLYNTGGNWTAQAGSTSSPVTRSVSALKQGGSDPADPASLLISFANAAQTNTTLASQNMSFGNTATGYFDGNVGNTASRGLVLNSRRTSASPASGGGQTVTVTFPQTVRDVSFRVRELSNYTAGQQEQFSVNVPSTITNSAVGTNIGLNAIGAVAANTKIYRTGTNTPRNNSSSAEQAYYYDVVVQIAGPLTSFAFTFDYRTYNGSAATAQSYLVAELNEFTFYID